METIGDYLHHFSRKLFEQITSAAMTVTDGKAAGVTQLCYTFLPFCLIFFFLKPALKEVCSVLRCWISFTWGDVKCKLKQGDMCKTREFCA